MDTVNFSNLKENIIRWIDRDVEEEELNTFKKSDKRENLSGSLPGFESGRKSLIDVLVHKNLYKKYLNYPGMMADLRTQVVNKFQTRYKPDDILRIFTEVLSGMKRRKREYDLIRINRESKGLIGIIARHKVKSVICSLAITASLVALAIFSWHYRKSR